ncbi:glycerate kinase type-2 family protein [Halobaculum lipolyticum]|uniref:Glycerate kinase n=1 Tax=Halobaculum lipolyticum TaxID=3032001 RepID=A0ABD5W6U0_9EURY|nr:DUF4147 domain-containing protein [Halobaculum sp. DT31]
MTEDAHEAAAAVAVDRPGADGDPTDAEATALACLEAGVAAALPARVVAASISLDGDTLRVGDASYDLTQFDDLFVVGGGKAADGVATALERLLGDRIGDGVVLVDEGPTEPADDAAAGAVRRIRGGHPVPTEAGVAGTARALELVRAADERTLVLAVVTGGASALFAAPDPAVGVDALTETTAALLRAGADVAEINAVRKHLSRVKGGRLAATAAPATVVGIAISDVVGDDPGVIGSGPTVPDESTFADAVAVLDRYDLDVPRAVRDHLGRGERGETDETPGPGDPAFDRVTTHVIATARTAIDAAAAAARDRGYEPLVLSSRIRGEAREAGVVHAAVAEEVATTGDPVEPPAVVLSGGETTVTVDGDGTGGPNLECALAAGVEFADPRSPLAGRDCAFLAVDTDGRDGSTDAAGALVTPDTVADRAAARAALADNDALPALREAGALLVTGATGTNVNDLRLVVVEE